MPESTDTKQEAGAVSNSSSTDLLGDSDLQEVELEFCSLGNRVRFKIRYDVIEEITDEANVREKLGDFDKEPYGREYWVEKEIVKHIMDDVNVWFPPFHP